MPEDEQGQPEQPLAAASVTDAPAAAETAPETITAEEHQRELTRARNQYGAERRVREELEKRLKSLEDERKTETERLTERAAQVEPLEATVTRLNEQVETLTAALVAEVDRQKKALPAELRELLPEDGSPVSQLDWLGKAAKVKPPTGLPPAGGRTGGNGGAKEPTDAERAAYARQTAQRF